MLIAETWIVDSWAILAQPLACTVLWSDLQYDGMVPFQLQTHARAYIYIYIYTHTGRVYIYI